MKRLTRICEGHYTAQHPTYADIEIHFFRIDGGLWGYSFDNGMTKGTGRTLKELKEKFYGA